MTTAIAQATLLDAIPWVRNTTDRTAKFPTPMVTQRVQRMDTGAIEEFTGSSWSTLVAGLSARATISLVDCGADPTGVIECSAAVALARTQSVANRNAPIFVDPGTYLLNAGAFFFINQMKLWGAGKGVSTIVQNSNGTLLELAGNNCEVIGLSINGNGKTGNQIRVTGGQDQLVDRCLVQAGVGPALAWAANCGVRSHIRSSQFFPLIDADVVIKCEGQDTGACARSVHNCDLTGGQIEVDGANDFFIDGCFGRNIIMGTGCLGVGIRGTKFGTLGGGTTIQGNGTSISGSTFAGTVTFSSDCVAVSYDASNVELGIIDNTLPQTTRVARNNIRSRFYDSWNKVSADRGDQNVTVKPGVDERTQRFATTLTADRTVTLSTTDAANGDVFRIVRTGLGAHTLTVNGRVIANSTAAWTEHAYNGSAWVEVGYSTL